MCSSAKLDKAELKSSKRRLFSFVKKMDYPNPIGELMQAIDNIDYYVLKYELGVDIDRDYHSIEGVDPEEENEQEVDLNVKTLAKEISTYEPQYTNAIFNIYQDYKKCVESESTRICAGLFLIAMARELIPLAGSGS